MRKNHLTDVTVIVLATVLVLLGLYSLPTLSVGEWEMREVDILADLRGDGATGNDSLSHAADSIERAMREVPPVLDGSHLTHDKNGNVITVEDSIMESFAALNPGRGGVQPIIDLSGNGVGGMEGFYEALDHADSSVVRIAVMGDSFIEGDILTSTLREMLQARFGGSGVGFVPITQTGAGLRRNLRHNAAGWTEHRFVGDSGYASSNSNLAASYFNAGPGAWINLALKGENFPHVTPCRSSSLYYYSMGAAGTVTSVVNGGSSMSHNLGGSTGGVGVITVTDNINSMKWQVNSCSPATVFLGASLDDNHGVTIDNLAMRSSSGLHLAGIPAGRLQDFDRVRHYDLVIIMYGLNVASKSKRDYTVYMKRIADGVNNLKQNLPGSSLMLVSCSDREQRTATGFRTIPGVLELIQVQKRVAINTRISFWNLYEAMGGEGSIVNMVNNREANSDYTHINQKGGERIAKLLYNAIVSGYEQHRSRANTLKNNSGN